MNAICTYCAADSWPFYSWRNQQLSSTLHTRLTAFKKTLLSRWPKIRTVIRQTREYSEVEWCTFLKIRRVHTVSFDWFLSHLEWILNMEFCLLKLLIFYQKLLWNIRSRLNSSTFWVFRPVLRYVWSKLKLCAQKMKILIKHI